MADHTPVEAENGAMPPTYDEAKGLTETMDQKVNIAPSDTKIEMGKEKEKEEEGFKALSKEELMQRKFDGETISIIAEFECKKLRIKSMAAWKLLAKLAGLTRKILSLAWPGLAVKVTPPALPALSVLTY